MNNYQFSSILALVTCIFSGNLHAEVVKLFHVRSDQSPHIETIKYEIMPNGNFVWRLYNHRHRIERTFRECAPDERTGIIYAIDDTYSLQIYSIVPSPFSIINRPFEEDDLPPLVIEPFNSGL